MLNKKVAIFDFDGTIVDSMDEFADIAAVVLDEFYGTPKSQGRADYMSTSGIPFFQQLELLHPKDKRNIDASAAFEERKMVTYLQKPVYPDVPKALFELKNIGILTVVSSNNFEERVKEYLGVNSLDFDMVLGFRDGFAKGHEHFEYVRSNLGVENKDIIFVGDSVKDAERAKDEGIDFAARLGIFGEDDFKAVLPNAIIVRELTELLSYIKGPKNK